MFAKVGGHWSIAKPIRNIVPLTLSLWQCYNTVKPTQTTINKKNKSAHIFSGVFYGFRSEVGKSHDKNNSMYLSFKFPAYKDSFRREAPDTHPKGWCLLVTYCILMQTALKGETQAAKLRTQLPVSNPLCRRPQAARAVRCTTRSPRISVLATSKKRTLKPVRN